jgi:hypothetical protein
MTMMPETTDNRKPLWISREDASALVEFFCFGVTLLESMPSAFGSVPTDQAFSEQQWAEVHTTYRRMLDRIGGLLGQLNLRLSPEAIAMVSQAARRALSEAGVEVVH